MSDCVTYAAVSADVLHHGHIRVLRRARELGGKVVVGLLTDDAVREHYKHTPIMNMEQRRALMESLVFVDEVIEQSMFSYTDVLNTLKPKFVVHGSNWAQPDHPQNTVRQEVLEILKGWGGQLDEIDFCMDTACRVVERVCMDRHIPSPHIQPQVQPRPKPSSSSDLLLYSSGARDHEGDVAYVETACAEREVPLVYVAMAADIVHHGHVNIIRSAAKLGRVVLGLLTDEAIETYKRRPICNFEQRCDIISSIRGVWRVMPQTTHDYVPNLRRLRPNFVVHGTDWKTGVQAKVRQRVIDVLDEWGGKLDEPEYTSDISTTELIRRLSDRYASHYSASTSASQSHDQQTTTKQCT